jgi:hypothetical protein
MYGRGAAAQRYGVLIFKKKKMIKVRLTEMMISGKTDYDLLR